MTPPRRRVAGVPAAMVEISEAEWAYAAQLAAADAAGFDAEWAALSASEREQFVAAHEWGPSGADPDAVLTSEELGSVEAGRASQWLGLLGTGAAGPVEPGELVAVAAADPGAGGRPGDQIAQLQVIDRLAAWVAARRHVVIGALCPPDHGDTDAGAYLAEQLPY